MKFSDHPDIDQKIRKVIPFYIGVDAFVETSFAGGGIKSPKKYQKCKLSYELMYNERLYSKILLILKKLDEISDEHAILLGKAFDPALVWRVSERTSSFIVVQSISYKMWIWFDDPDDDPDLIGIENREEETISIGTSMTEMVDILRSNGYDLPFQMPDGTYKTLIDLGVGVQEKELEKFVGYNAM